MKLNTLADKELGIRMARRFYLFLLIFYAFPFFLFSVRLEILEQEVNEQQAMLINLAIIFLIYFIYDAIRHIKEMGFYAGYIFHSFFLVNGILMLFEAPSILSMQDINQSKPAFKTQIIIASLTVNLAMLIWLNRLNLKYHGKAKSRPLAKTHHNLYI
jgi:hypothetical protein